MCSLSCSSKAESLEESLLPQTEAVLFCDYSCSSLTEFTYIGRALSHRSYIFDFPDNISHTSRVVRQEQDSLLWISAICV